MKLIDFYKQSNFDTKRKLARELGISPSLLTRWMNGERKPALEKIPVIEKITERKVTLLDFLS